MYFCDNVGGVIVFIIAHFRVLSTEFSKKIKVFRFGNSCALCARLPRQLRVGAWVCLGVCAGVCYARIKVRATLGGGFWARCNPPFLGCFRPRFGWGWRLVLGGFVGGCFGVGCRGWFWWLFGGVCGWVYSLALTRSRLTDSRKTAHGSRLAGVRLLAVGVRLLAVGVRVGGGVRPSNLIFLALIIFAVWWGVFYSQTATEKRRTVCVRSLSLPRPFFRTPNTSVR